MILSDVDNGGEGMMKLTKILCLLSFTCRYQHAVANPGLITFTGPYLDVAGAGYVVTISHTIHASR